MAYVYMNHKGQYLKVSTVSGFGHNQLSAVWGELDKATDFPYKDPSIAFKNSTFKGMTPIITAVFEVEVVRKINILGAVT